MWHSLSPPSFPLWRFEFFVCVIFSNKRLSLKSSLLCHLKFLPSPSWQRCSPLYCHFVFAWHKSYNKSQPKSKLSTVLTTARHQARLCIHLLQWLNSFVYFVISSVLCAQFSRCVQNKVYSQFSQWLSCIVCTWRPPWRRRQSRSTQPSHQPGKHTTKAAFWQ